jgi:predicted aminopeptidase
MKRHKKTLMIVGSLLMLVLWTADWFLPLSYVAKQALFQGELLWGRVPIETIIEHGDLTDNQRKRLRDVRPIKEFGQKLGLASSENYDTISPNFTRTIWNVSACEPLSFSAKKWWFPIVGSVPYLGFFKKEEARAAIQTLKTQGYDTTLRTAGAYSTLGWFQDPVLPSMLDWSEYRLANTLLHELAHATIWYPGSVQFNESFANFIGDEASMRYMLDRYGENSPQLRRLLNGLKDQARYRDVMVQLYQELDTVYRNPDLTDTQKHRQKARLFARLSLRFSAVSFHQPARYQRLARTSDWNNAKVMQFRRYNRSREWFQTVLDQEDGDLLRFMDRIHQITQTSNDPYQALEQVNLQGSD